MVIAITGASRGLGEALAREWLRYYRSRLRTREAHVTLLLAARSRDRLEQLANDLLQQECEPSFADMITITTCEYDGTRDASTTELIERLQELCTEDARRAIAASPAASSTLIVVAAAGSHEPATVPTGTTYRYSTADDFDAATKAASRALNVGSPVRLCSSLASSASLMALGVALHFVFISSQAADDKWWPLGNALYGPHKLEAERRLEAVLVELTRARTALPSALLVHSLRYPLIATPMAEQLYTELLPVEAALHVDRDLSKPGIERAAIFHPVDVVARRTVNWIVAVQLHHQQHPALPHTGGVDLPSMQYGFEPLVDSEMQHTWNYCAPISGELSSSSE